MLNLTIVDTRYLFHAGNIYLEQLNYPEAIDYFEQVLQKEPGHRRAALNLLASRTSQAKIFFIAGRTAFRKEDFLKARELLSDVLELDPAYPLAREYLDETNSSLSAMARALFDEGESLLASDQPRDALEKISLGRSYAPKDRQGRKLLKKAQEAAAHQIAALMERAEEERAANHFDLAEASYSQVIHLVPDHEEALAALQEIAVQRRTLHDAAVATAKKALEGGDIKAATTQFLAVLEQAPDHLEAQEGLQSAKALLASMVEQILQRARQERSAGRIDNARNEYYEALALREDPIIQKELEALEQQQQEKIDALLASARLAASQGKISKSLTAYDKILHRLPEHKVAKEEKESLIKKRAQDLKELLLRANALLVTENFAEALAIYRRALDLDPRSKEASAGIVDGKKRLSATIATLLQSGNTQLQEGELDAAETSYQKLLALDPYHKQAKGGLEQVAARRSAGVAPGDEKRLYLQGIELYTRGKYLDAVTVWEKVLILSPEHAKARANIEKARRKIRQIEEFRNG
ncbi:MAG: hypothetical protein C0621_08415 [Desulfuromonas sp.]|nr:MAG: hypothetical protein C0621_08415 [Desulfuromonas sp.]